MTVPELFSLRWNDFHNNLWQGIHSFLESEDMVDVTLAAEGELMRAHKLILSLCSPYFRELFKCHMQSNPCGHPIVIIKDVLAEHLKLILKFIYTGEVTIHRKDLSGFLQTAETLQVKGLTTGTGKCDGTTSELTEKKVSAGDSSPHTLHTDENNVLEDTNKNEEGNSTQTTILDVGMPAANYHDDLKRPNNYDAHEISKKMKKEVSDSASSSGSEIYDTDPEYADMRNIIMARKFSGNTSFEQHMDTEDLLTGGTDRNKKVSNDCTATYTLDHSDLPKEDGGWKPKVGGVKCPSCNRIFANRYNLKVHVRDKHDTMEGTLECHICHKSMRNPSCLRVHLYHHRKQAALEQNNRDHQATTGGGNDENDPNSSTDSM